MLDPRKFNVLCAEFDRLQGLTVGTCAQYFYVGGLPNDNLISYIINRRAQGKFRTVFFPPLSQTEDSEEELNDIEEDSVDSDDNKLIGVFEFSQDHIWYWAKRGKHQWSRIDSLDGVYDCKRPRLESGFGRIEVYRVEKGTGTQMYESQQTSKTET